MAKGPGGHPGNDSASSAAGSHPARRLFGQATPGPGHHDTTRHQGSHTLTVQADFKENPENHLTAATKRTRSVGRRVAQRWLAGASRTSSGAQPHLHRPHDSQVRNRSVPNGRLGPFTPRARRRPSSGERRRGRACWPCHDLHFISRGRPRGAQLANDGCDRRAYCMPDCAYG
jgi:hypothetical protein